MDQQIATVRAALEAVESAITQTEAALATAGAQDMPALRSVLVDLKAERAKLQFQLASLEAAAVEVQPLGGPARVGLRAPTGAADAAPLVATARQRTEMKAIEKALKSSVTDRSVALISLKLASDVLKQTNRLLMIGGDDEPAPLKGSTRKVKASAPGGRKTAKRGRAR